MTNKRKFYVFIVGFFCSFFMLSRSDSVESLAEEFNEFKKTSIKRMPDEQFEAFLKTKFKEDKANLDQKNTALFESFQLLASIADHNSNTKYIPDTYQKQPFTILNIPKFSHNDISLYGKNLSILKEFCYHLWEKEISQEEDAKSLANSGITGEQTQKFFTKIHEEFLNNPGLYIYMLHLRNNPINCPQQRRRSSAGISHMSIIQEALRQTSSSSTQDTIEESFDLRNVSAERISTDRKRRPSFQYFPDTSSPPPSPSSSKADWTKCSITARRDCISLKGSLSRGPSPLINSILSNSSNIPPLSLEEIEESGERSPETNETSEQISENFLQLRLEGSMDTRP